MGFPLLQNSADTCVGNIENEDGTDCGVESLSLVSFRSKFSLNVYLSNHTSTNQKRPKYLLYIHCVHVCACVCMFVCVCVRVLCCESVVSWQFCYKSNERFAEQQQDPVIAGSKTKQRTYTNIHQKGVLQNRDLFGRYKGGYVWTVQCINGCQKRKQTPP